jgi:hypothetical protein
LGKNPLNPAMQAARIEASSVPDLPVTCGEGEYLTAFGGGDKFEQEKF